MLDNLPKSASLPPKLSSYTKTGLYPSLPTTKEANGGPQRQQHYRAAEFLSRLLCPSGCPQDAAAQALSNMEGPICGRKSLCKPHSLPAQFDSVCHLYHSCHQGAHLSQRLPRPPTRNVDYEAHRRAQSIHPQRGVQVPTRIRRVEDLRHVCLYRMGGF
jgi:hypothetical protein